MNKEMTIELKILLKEILEDHGASHKDLEQIDKVKFDHIHAKKWNIATMVIDRILSGPILTGKMLEQLYVAMAMNPAEVCRMIESKLDSYRYETVVKYAQFNPYPEVRRQIVESLGRKKPIYAENYLIKYLEDEDSLVVKTALIELETVNIDLAKDYAKKYVFHADVGIKEIAGRVLRL